MTPEKSFRSGVQWVREREPAIPLLALECASHEPVARRTATQQAVARSGRVLSLGVGFPATSTQPDGSSVLAWHLLRVTDECPRAIADDPVTFVDGAAREFSGVADRWAAVGVGVAECVVGRCFVDAETKLGVALRGGYGSRFSDEAARHLRWRDAGERGGAHGAGERFHAVRVRRHVDILLQRLGYVKPPYSEQECSMISPDERRRRPAMSDELRPAKGGVYCGNESSDYCSDLVDGQVHATHSGGSVDQ